ncbi:hypothetical protein B5K06_28310 [Rhizobium grahamii]|uniref:Uncharacterized protein n=2 Tax=Rhizobium grahamii TaxID=1120045 RepID=S3HDH4_9HYPH|nr:hypothetical protein RGCCGE502_18175 [Rhizobium grahamii CCGE 502]RDJ03828.1 hypothetical protein B5K06_28310 [Rhizobium grahamii]
MFLINDIFVIYNFINPSILPSVRPDRVLARLDASKLCDFEVMSRNRLPKSPCEEPLDAGLPKAECHSSIFNFMIFNFFRNSLTSCQFGGP